jgi:hypothetical protein
VAKKKRIDRAFAALRPAYKNAGLSSELAETIEDMQWCRETRNQFAHCHWDSWNAFGLKFVDLEHVASLTGRVRKGALSSKRVRLATLQDQESFFLYVAECFETLAHAYGCTVDGTSNGGLPGPGKMKRLRKHD